MFYQIAHCYCKKPATSPWFFYIGILCRKKSQCSEVIVHLMFQISHYLTLTIPDRKSLSGWMTFQSRLKASHISTFDAVILPSLCAVLDWRHWWCSYQGHDKCSCSFSVFMHVCSKKYWCCGGSDGWAKILSMCSIRWLSLYLGPWYSFSVKLIYRPLCLCLMQAGEYNSSV